jgi:Zn-dependent protease with chaperone function
MNFFESQDTAKRNTGRLILLFVLAVLSLIIITNLLVMLLLGFAGSEMTSMAAAETMRFDWGTFLLIGAAVTGVVLLGSLYKIASLRGGGARVAEMMNARLLLAGSQDLQEQRVLNVVEEMAIASGIPVPPVYLMEEPGINAFAAGYSPSDAIVAVTRGTIDTLSREQLQGVIAHEFSHILHGDMRINIRLIGVLHGIMVLGLIGYHLLRGSMYSRRSKNSGGIVFIGIGLVVIGFVGTFFGNLIKAAVSRQREYLADASAVQFTRNPDGIAGALMQIANHSEHSYLNNPNSAEISHTLFEEGRVSALSRMYATHPPLAQRIQAILPNWDGSYKVRSDPTAAAAQASSADAKSAAATQQEKARAMLGGVAGVLITDAIIGQVGNPQPQHLDYANALLHKIPEVLIAAAREPSGARAVVYFLVLDSNDSERREQLSFVEASADLGVYAELQNLLAVTDEVDAEQRLPLTEIAISSLRQLSAKQYQLFKSNFHALIALDNKVNLFEWALQKIVFHHLGEVFEKNHSRKPGKRDLKQCQAESALLLSILAHSNTQTGITAAAAYTKGAEKLGITTPLQATASISFEALNTALDLLVRLKPLQKPALLKACVACITADEKVAPIEAELLRAIAAVIDCPLPPFVV